MTPRTASFALGLRGLTGLVHDATLVVRDTLGVGSRARQGEHDRLIALDQGARNARGEITDLVKNSFMTPFDRGDLHALTVGLADCLTHLERAVDASIRHRVEEFPEGTAGMVDALVRMAELTVEGVAGLHTSAGVGDYFSEVRRLGVRAEQARREIMTVVLSGHGDPLRSVRTACVVDEFAAAIRGLEQVATIVEGIVVKES